MGSNLSTLQQCDTPTATSDFSRKFIWFFGWRDEYRVFGVLNAVVEKGHLAQDPTSVELIGKFLADFAADFSRKGAEMAATPAVYALLVKHCFKYATTSDSVTALGRAISNISEKCDAGKKMFSTAETVDAIAVALFTYATTAASVAMLASVICNIAKDNVSAKKLCCTPAILLSVVNALRKYSEATSSFTGLCNVIKTLCTDHRMGQELFSDQDCANEIARLIEKNVALPERILELLLVVTAITEYNLDGQRIFFAPEMGLAIAKAFDKFTGESFRVVKALCAGSRRSRGLFSNRDCANKITELVEKHAADPERILHLMHVIALITKDNIDGQRFFFTSKLGLAIEKACDQIKTFAHIRHLSDAIREVVFNMEGVTESLFMTRSLVSAFTRILKSVPTVTMTAQNLLEGNPVGIKVFADDHDFMDELKRIDEFSLASKPEGIRSLRQLRLLLLTRDWGENFTTVCCTDPRAYCRYSCCPACEADLPPQVAYSSMDDVRCAMTVASWVTCWLVPPVVLPCMMFEAVCHRRIVKLKYNIDESIVWMGCACLFPCNAMVQHNHEIKRRADDGKPARQVDVNDPVFIANRGVPEVLRMY